MQALVLIGGKSFAADLFDQIRTAFCCDLSVHNDICVIHVQGLQYFGIVGDDQKASLLLFLVGADSLGDNAHGVDVEAGVRLVKDGQ